MATYPTPIPGLVLRYTYLWKSEFDEGKVDGRKHRPCVVVVCVEDVDGHKVVTVAPITHTPPEDSSRAIELTPATRRRLGLDEEKNWIIATEVNSFDWPGPDLVLTSRQQYAYGELPAVVFNALKEKILREGEKLKVVGRT
ncbi:hypothetical protein D0B54_08945 [Solimonas sp. K1W22B-7]|uniref:type II toxin-antitoxin system PemK/MazF family toxin n=1 Tax=Solimonas sp. K1W22B-7 TaxID=2303331 RepID=UPI000E33103E|nr:type II toxin-antitoxin system PemK/MazF family toxin [Solimonas sp. K1W22B-7]AXQ28802.1 hypothetical protein D0B54_08945 [Solimonas sp. K1W22B-7]